MSFKSSIVWISILLSFGTSFNAGAFSMFNSKKQPSKELYDTLQSTELTQKFITQNGFNLKDLEISKARIQGIKAKDFSFSNILLKNYDSRKSTLENGVFKDIEFDDVYFNESTITNVTFKNSNLTKVNFFGVNFTNTKFIDCKITKSAFFELIDSDIEFINTKIYDNEYKFSDSQIQLRLINSEVKNTDFMSLKEGSSVYLENSEIQTSFKYSKLKSFEIINSKITDTTAADSEIDKFIINNSYLDFSSGRAIFNEIIIKDSEIPNFGAIKIKANKFTVSSCKEIADISFAKSQIKEIQITDCDFSELYPIFITSDSLLIENSTIAETAFVESKIKNLTLKNITFTKEADFTDLNATSSTIENITKGPNLKLIMDGANIEF